jgi:hypothetical protein
MNAVEVSDLTSGTISANQPPNDESVRSSRPPPYQDRPSWIAVFTLSKREDPTKGLVSSTTTQGVGLLSAVWPGA